MQIRASTLLLLILYFASTLPLLNFYICLEKEAIKCRLGSWKVRTKGLARIKILARNFSERG